MSGAMVCASSGETNSCVKRDSTYRIRVNTDKNQVLVNGSMKKDCRVYDKKNWKCGRATGTANIISGMKEGHFYEIFKVYRAESGSYSCGL